jgi:hypothetical protein
MIPDETITDVETNRLLQEAARRDQRSIGANDIAAWYTDLNVARINYDDALAAVSQYYSVHWPKQPPAQRFRLTAPVLIELVGKIREARHEAANFVYEPVDGETGYEYAARKQRMLRAIGDGQQPTYSARELSRSVAENKAQLAALVSGVGQRLPLPPEIAQVLANARPAGLEATCPRCHAEPNRKCTDPGTGRQMKRLHDSRIAAWAIVATACPECRAPVGEVCTQLGEPFRDHAHQTRIKAARSAEPVDQGA